MRNATECVYLESMDAHEKKPRRMVDLKTREVLECNDSAAALWGYTPPEMVGMSSERLIHPDERERALAVREEHVSGDAGTWKCMRKDGTMFFLHITVRRGMHEGRLCGFAEAAS
jgi:PAS domain S-box-containing protein